MALVNLFTAAGKAIAEWHRQQRAYAELMALDDRSLADIGIRRSEIRAVLAADRKAAKVAAPTASPQPHRLGRHQAA